MNPAFFLIFFLIPAAAFACVALFVVLKVFTPLRWSVLLAPLLVASGLLGCLFGLVTGIVVAQLLQGDEARIYSVLGAILFGGAGFFGFALALAWQISWFNPAKSSSPAAPPHRTRRR